MNNPVHVVILAAGKGTRMFSDQPKVLHRVGGVPMLDYVLRTAAELGPASTTVVIGHMADAMRTHLETHNVAAAVQEPQLGTGHALQQAIPRLEGSSGTLIVVYGDVPLLKGDTLRRLLRHHASTGAAATVLTVRLPDPTGYGRIVREDARVTRIVEERDATPAERAIDEVNSGIYAFDLTRLIPALASLAPDNAQKEYYLTDLVRIFREAGHGVETVMTGDPAELRGINSRDELAAVNAVVRDRRNQELMAAGVTMVDPLTTWVGPDVQIGRDVVLHPSVYLEGRTRIGDRCEIQAGVRIVDSEIDADVLVQNYCVIRQSRVAAGAELGPFAHVRPNSRVEAGAHVGNFVELKKTRLGAGSKANHLAYLGDATIGERVNIGAGTITCNYDGEKKHPTIIEDGVFVGSDSQLVAPVRLGAGAYVAAGSSITQDVPAGALAIARARQENKPGWVARKKAAKGAVKR